MKSLIDSINRPKLEDLKTVNLYDTNSTNSQWVDVLEVNGRGVAEYLKVSSASDYVDFKITIDGIEWKVSMTSSKSVLEIMSERMVFGAPFLSSAYVLVRYTDGSLRPVNCDNVKFLTKDSVPVATDTYHSNIMLGGITFNKNFKVSMYDSSGYTKTVQLVYKLV